MTLKNRIKLLIKIRNRIKLNCKLKNEDSENPAARKIMNKIFDCFIVTRPAAIGRFFFLGCNLSILMSCISFSM